jgi:hypothetical protein
MLNVGGNWNNGSNAGVRTANANNSPGNANTNIGARAVNCVLPVVQRSRSLCQSPHTPRLNPVPGNWPNIKPASDSQ